MDARARENEITGVRTMYKTNRSLMNLGARDYSTFIKETFITYVKPLNTDKFGSMIILIFSFKIKDKKPIAQTW